jgi:valyl-tRNA synthetase
LRVAERFFWHIYCDNYLEIVKGRAGFEGRPTAEQRSALHTLWHATSTIIRLFAPFMPYITDALHELCEDEVRGRDSTVHARGQWSEADTHADPGLNRELGDAFVEVIAAGRKIKSDLFISLRAPVATLTIGPQDASMDVEKIKRLFESTADDLRSVLNARALVWASAVPEDQPSSATPDERFRVALKMAEPERAEAASGLQS